MLIARPGYRLTWNRDGEQEKVGFPKKKIKSLLLEVRMEIGQAESTDAFQIRTVKSVVPYGLTSPMMVRFCPAQKRKVVSGAPRRTGYDLDSSSNVSFFPLLTSSLPNPQTPSRCPPAEEAKEKETQ